VATREYIHPATGKSGEYTEAAARRFGLIPVDAAPAAEPVEADADAVIPTKPRKGKKEGE
jgi:hypothetical protein